MWAVRLPPSSRRTRVLSTTAHQNAGEFQIIIVCLAQVQWNKHLNWRNGLRPDSWRPINNTSLEPISLTLSAPALFWISLLYGHAECASSLQCYYSSSRVHSRREILIIIIIIIWHLKCKMIYNANTLVRVHTLNGMAGSGIGLRHMWAFRIRDISDCSNQCSEAKWHALSVRHINFICETWNHFIRHCRFYKSTHFECG